MGDIFLPAGTEPHAIANCEGFITSCDQAFSTILGFSEDELAYPKHNIVALAKFVTFEDPQESFNIFTKLAIAVKERGTIPNNFTWRAPLGKVSSTIYLDHYEICVSGLSDLSPCLKVVLRPYERYLFADSKESDYPQIKSVVLVDDSRADVNQSLKVLEGSGFNCFTFDDVKSAFKSISESDGLASTIVLINPLLENALSTVFDYRSQEKLKRRASPSGGASTSNAASKLFIVALSGDFNNTIIHEVMSAGFDAYLHKPVSVVDLLEAARSR